MPTSLSVYKNQLDFRFIYLPLNQTRIDFFTYRNLLLRKRELENSKLNSYKTIVMFLWFFNNERKDTAIKASAWAELKIGGYKNWSWAQLDQN